MEWLLLLEGVPWFPCLADRNYLKCPRPCRFCQSALRRLSSSLRPCPPATPSLEANSASSSFSAPLRPTRIRSLIRLDLFVSSIGLTLPQLVFSPRSNMSILVLELPRVSSPRPECPPSPLAWPQLPHRSPLRVCGEQQRMTPILWSTLSLRPETS